MKNRPIGVFDSGLGGISVLRALVQQLPGEDFLYFGDSANAPYGGRSTEEIRLLTLQCCEMLLERGCKALVLACNTATSAAVTELRRRYPDTIIIGIEPALKLAVQRHPDGKILVLATEATLREKKFAALMARYEQDCEICKCPCPELVAFVERGELEGPALEAVLQSRLGPFLTPKPQAIVLGCTHYPFLSKTISAVVGNETELLDGSEGTAKETARRLREAGLLSDRESGHVCFENSLPSEEILHRAKSLYEGSFCRGGNLPPV